MNKRELIKGISSLILCFLALMLFHKSCTDDTKKWMDIEQQKKEIAYKCKYKQGEIVGSKCFKDGVEI